MTVPRLVSRRSFLLSAFAGNRDVEQIEVWRAGEGGYHTYRIPALLRTRRGTLLAFCEGRRQSRGDSGDIDLLLKRSVDGGRNWSASQVVADHGPDTIGNPCPVQERSTGVIWLPLTRNSGDKTEKQIRASEPGATRTVWITSSRDDGATWADAVEITTTAKREDWTWYATGPGVSIQLASGRLLVPCDHGVRGKPDDHFSHVIYSDDRGRTWNLGGVVGNRCGESCVVELGDRSLLINMRSYHGKNRRAVSRSRDAGRTWSDVELDDALIEPICQGCLYRHGKFLLFSNPASTRREKMTVRLSRDWGRTWASARVLHEGPSAYSCLTSLGRNTVGCLYERGDAAPYEKITFARFPLNWLTP